MNHCVKHFVLTKLFLDTIRVYIMSSDPKSYSFDTALGHIISQQCKPKQLKRHKEFINKDRKIFLENSTFLTMRQPLGLKTEMSRMFHIEK